jgi:hypothetical protein
MAATSAIVVTATIVRSVQRREELERGAWKTSPLVTNRAANRTNYNF